MIFTNETQEQRLNTVRSRLAKPRTSTAGYVDNTIAHFISLNQVNHMLDDPNLDFPDTMRYVTDSCESNRTGGMWQLAGLNDVSFTHISMCINEDREQSLCDLALRLAISKEGAVHLAVQKVCALAKEGKLFYYETSKDGSVVRMPWKPGEGVSLMTCARKKLLALHRVKANRHTRGKADVNAMRAFAS